MSLQSSENFARDNLWAGTQVQPVVANSETLAAGQGLLVRGTVLGKVTATKKCVIVDSSAETGAPGSGVVYAVLAEDTDTTGGDKAAPVYYTGEYNERELVFGGTDTAETHRDAAKQIGIFFKDTVAK